MADTADDDGIESRRRGRIIPTEHIIRKAAYAGGCDHHRLIRIPFQRRRTLIHEMGARGGAQRGGEGHPLLDGYRTILLARFNCFGTGCQHGNGDEAGPYGIQLIHMLL